VPLAPLDALDRAARLVGDRWSLLVLGALLDGDRRYGELLEQINGISTNVLAQRLAALEAAHLVVAEPYNLRPPRMRYALTNDGRALAGPLSALSAWGAQRDIDTDSEMNGDNEFRLVHSSCGTPLETAWHCPTCDVEVDLHAQAPSASLDDTIVFNA
jgi:DNA-binding HxlR family transcriptional regulator